MSVRGMVDLPCRGPIRPGLEHPTMHCLKLDGVITDGGSTLMANDPPTFAIPPGFLGIGRRAMPRSRSQAFRSI